MKAKQKKLIEPLHLKGEILKQAGEGMQNIIKEFIANDIELLISYQFNSFIVFPLRVGFCFDKYEPIFKTSEVLHVKCSSSNCFDIKEYKISLAKMNRLAREFTADTSEKAVNGILRFHDPRQRPQSRKDWGKWMKFFHKNGNYKMVGYLYEATYDKHRKD